jgi:hypothetical protein
VAGTDAPVAVAAGAVVLVGTGAVVGAAWVGAAAGAQAASASIVRVNRLVQKSGLRMEVRNVWFINKSPYFLLSLINHTHWMINWIYIIYIRTSDFSYFGGL